MMSRISTIVLFLASLLGASGLRAGEMDAAPSVHRWATTVTPVGEEFLTESDIAWKSVPRGLWEAIHQAGWQVRLSEFVVDAVPHLRGVQPRGWPTDFTWDHTDAVSLPRSRLLILAEKHRRRSGEAVFSKRIAGVFRHELGHAFDTLRGGNYRYRSWSSEFLDAYRHDVARWSADDRRELAYYLQEPTAGRQEAFAEAFAITLGGGSDVTKRSQFERSFSEVLRFLNREVDDYATE